MNPDTYELARLLASHQRLDPMTANDRCTCGRKTPLGKMFHEHVAEAVKASGWVKA